MLLLLVGATGSDAQDAGIIIAILSMHILTQAYHVLEEVEPSVKQFKDYTYLCVK